MAFKVTQAKWLEMESARVREVILMPKFWGVRWNQSKLRKELADIGLHYSKEEIGLLNDELHKQGIVEDVAED